ncbi:MAG: S-adenosylmethionine:tRNA ribosyltransferase-isomerase [Gammaproteobacteria bacterium]|jgi:S-adenosylmethionine:tRNA ribosyltransferase-isomerase
MNLSDFDFHLPENLIAQQPLENRSDSRLLVVEPDTDKLADSQFNQLESFLRQDDLLVFNDTRVIPARLFGQKATGGKIEVLVERVIDEKVLLAQVRASKSPKPGSRLILESAFDCVMVSRRSELFELYLDSSESWFDLLERYGRMPLPPYIERADNIEDRERYQTIFADKPGAVAAPTAGLHFDETLLGQLSRSGVNTSYLTLHVGAGTFQPVRVARIEDHVMHSERVLVPESTCDLINQTREKGGRVIAVGTTVVRSLETAATKGEMRPFDGESSIFIKPGYQFQIVDAMITNFHLPKSTLLMLVSAFAGRDLMLNAYQHAVEQQYRFFSYGDAMLISTSADSKH